MNSCSEDDEAPSPYVTRQGARELAMLGGLGRGSELALVQRTAEQQAQLSAASERIDSLERQRFWMLGGLGVSALVLVFLAVRRKPAAKPETEKKAA